MTRPETVLFEAAANALLGKQISNDFEMTGHRDFGQGEDSGQVSFQMTAFRFHNRTCSVLERKMSG